MLFSNVKETKVNSNIAKTIIKANVFNNTALDQVLPGILV